MAVQYVLYEIGLLLLVTAHAGEDSSFVREAGRCSLTNADRESCKAETGSVSEILMRQSPFLLQKQNHFYRRALVVVVVFMPLYASLKCVASVSTGVRGVRCILPYQIYHPAAPKTLQPPPSAKWKRAHLHRIRLQLIVISLHRHDTQTLSDRWYKFKDFSIKLS